MATGGMRILRIVNRAGAAGVLRIGIVAVPGGFRIRAAILTEESEEPEPEHVERGHDQAVITPIAHKTCGPAAPRGQEDLVLREESGERWNAGDGKGGDCHGPEGIRHVLPQAAHVAHVLLAAESVNDRAGSRGRAVALKKAWVIRWKMPRNVVRHAAGHEHVAELRDRGVGQHFLDVVLSDADSGGEERRQRAHDSDHQQRIRRAAEDGDSSAPPCRRRR